MGPEILDRIEQAVAKVRERLLRATAALNQAGIPYAVVGGNAVASWVATVDEGAVRNTRDVDILVRRDDLAAITTALESAAFVGGEMLDVVIFRDGPDGRPSESVRLLFSGERYHPSNLLKLPEIDTVYDPASFHVITLQSLAEMKLVANRAIDNVHIRDLIGVGLIEASWLDKLPPELAERLKQILETPDG